MSTRKGSPMRRMVLAISVAVALAVVACGDDEPSSPTTSGTAAAPTTSAPAELPTLRFSAIPDQDETRLREKFQPVAEYLEQVLGVPVEYVHSDDYDASVVNFKNGEIQLAWFGGLTGVQAREAVEGAHAIAQGIEDPEFYSYFIVNAATGIEPADEFPQALQGLSFTFGSAGSTSGRLLPEHFIRQETGLAPEDFFGEISFSGSHDKTAELVEAGTFQAGAINYLVYESRVERGLTDPDVVKVVWVTPPYADYNFTAHPDLEAMFGAGFTDRLQQALIDMTDPELLSAFPREGLIKATDEEYAAIRELAEQLGFLR